MKLAHPIFEEPINFKNGLVNVVVIENPSMLSKMIIEFKNQINKEEGKFVLSDDRNEMMDISKKSEMYIDLFSFDFNNKKIISKIYHDLRDKAMGESFYVSTSEISNTMMGYLENLINSVDVPLIIPDELDMISFFKFAGIKVDYNYESEAERLIDYLSLVSEVLSVELVIFVNLKSFLTQKDIKHLYKWISYNEKNILLLESTTRENSYEEEKIFIIDEDLCQIY